MRLGHSVPGADPTSVVFSPRNSEYLGTQQPVSEQMWDQRRVLTARVSPGSPLSCSRPCWYTRQQHIPGLQDQFKPIWRRVSWVILGMGELSLFGQGQSEQVPAAAFLLSGPPFGRCEATGRLHSDNFLEPKGKGPFGSFLGNPAPAAERARRSLLGPGLGGLGGLGGRRPLAEP